MVESKNYDLTTVLKEEHAGKWVALSSDRTKVLGYSESFKELEETVGKKNVVYMKALPKDVKFAF